MRLRLPMAATVKAMTRDNQTPLRGLLAGPSPLAKGFKTLNIRSLARDWRIRGAPRKDAMAEERVAAITPALIKGLNRATDFMAP